MIHAFLEKYYPYYQNLQEDDKVIFQTRVQDFIKGRDFKGRRGFEITSEAKVLISAFGIQLSFGLEQYMFPHFNTIIVYPDDYFSLITKRYHKGEVNLQGAIVFSWKDLLNGLKHPDDGLNTGIHEFAHAVYFENFIENAQFGFLDKQALTAWMNSASARMIELRSGTPELIRSYATKNTHEFFAICSELFFEKPHELKKHFKDIYTSLVQLYKQDPAI